MFPIVEYSYDTLEHLINHAKEISQEDNINANSKLFILNNKTVFKMYIPEAEGYLRNLTNLLLIKERQELKAITELVLPTELIKLNQNIIGYFMPYIEGKDLFAYLSDSSFTNRQKLHIFTQLAKVINQLPPGIHIGDLHANNIIIDQYQKIHLIDIDGFSIDWGEQLSIPTPLPYIFGKYYNAEGIPIISKNSDIYCVFRLFIRFIFQGYEILDCKYREEYISFLKRKKGTEILTHELKLLYNTEDNILDDKTFDYLCIDEISLNSFFKNKNLAAENQIAESILRKYIGGI